MGRGATLSLITKMKKQLLIAGLVLFIASGALAQKNMAAKKLRRDFDFLVAELRAKHQGLYQYLPRTEVDRRLDSLRQSIGDNLSRMDFYRIVLQVVELTNEGHTEARLPPRTKLRLGWSKTFFPLALSHHDGKWIITQNFGAERPTLQKGQELLRLNGQSVDSLARSFFPYLASDGFNQTSKYEWVGSLNFALFYRLVYGPVDQFRLTVRAMDGPQTFTVELDPVRFTAYKKKNAKFPPRYFEYTRFTRRILNDSIAYLSVPSFGGRAQTFADYSRMAFSEIDSLGIQHLIIDIQDNGGGTEGNENLLFSYLTDQAIRKYRRVTMRQAPFLDN